MSEQILGIHHVTAIASDPQTNVDFYAGLLGLRMVKKTVNFDDPGTYHLYYGDEQGSPGTILTFFPWPGARRGSRGAGQATVTSFAVPEGSLSWWRDRLSAAGVVVADTVERFGEDSFTFLDPDGLLLEMVADPSAAERAPWSDGPVPEQQAIRGFHSMTLLEADAARTAELLTGAMGFRLLGQEGEQKGERSRFAFGEDGAPGTRLDVIHRPGESVGRVAAGSIHHIAFRVAGDAEELAWQRRLMDAGMGVTEVKDRQYFHSIYFREPGGVLFEIATDPPGFTLDEPLAELGTSLRLPPWYESRRSEIEAVLPPLKDPADLGGGAGEVDR
ncbi:MAG: ring-cleaving dioxygenase [Acidobacteriota bacterium]|nr:ring-cleaving dioxygenase [Acidobacteriota bacterium]